MDKGRLASHFLVVLVILAFQAGCGNSNSINSGSTQIRGIASIHEPIEGGTVELFDRYGNRLNLFDTTTNENGAFSSSTRNFSGGYVRIEVKGGVFANSRESFEGTLCYIAESHEASKHTFYHVGPFSTTAANYVFAHPEKTVNESTVIVRNFFGISDTINIDNDLYFYERPLPPALYWSLVRNHGGLTGFFAMLIPYIDSKPNGWPALSATRSTTAMGDSEASVAGWLGQQLAAGAVSYIGGQGAGWILSSTGIQEDDTKKIADQLSSIQSAILGAEKDILQIGQRIDQYQLHNMISKAREDTEYFHTINDRLWHHAQAYPKGSCSNYSGGAQKNCNDDLTLTGTGIITMLNSHDIKTTLNNTHDAIYEDDMLGIFDLENNTPHGSDYYNKLEEFMAYWFQRQLLGFNLHMEKLHRDIDSIKQQQILDDVKEFDSHMKLQSSYFLKLVEKNLSIDVVTVDAYEKYHLKPRGNPPALNKRGCMLSNPDWTANNWSFFPSVSYKEETVDIPCPSIDGGICRTDFTRTVDSFWNTSKPSPHMHYFNLSPELQRADDLVYAYSIYDSTGTYVPNRKPIVIRGYIPPISHGLARFDKNNRLPWNSSDDLPVMTLRRIKGDKLRSAVGYMIHEVSVPDVYYAGSKPEWGTKGQYVRFVFEDVQDGQYKLDTLDLNDQYSQHLQFGGSDAWIKYIDDYYGSYTLNYSSDGPSQSMLMLMYTVYPWHPD